MLDGFSACTATANHAPLLSPPTVGVASVSFNPPMATGWPKLPDVVVGAATVSVSETVGVDVVVASLQPTTASEHAAKTKAR